MKTTALILLLATLASSPSIRAAEAAAKGPPRAADSRAKEPSKEAAKDKDKDKNKDNEERKVETDHTATIGGQEISYKATAGTILLRDDEDKPTASIFYIAYTREHVEDVTKRPITFSFNGGPGSSSVWMHLGMLGPRRVRLGEDGSALPPPYRLEDNEDSLLDVSDLVFVDPVSTGYSRAIPTKDARKFHGLREDAASVAEFIRLYVSRNRRWTSPKFIIGESLRHDPRRRAFGRAQPAAADECQRDHAGILRAQLSNARFRTR